MSDGERFEHPSIVRLCHWAQAIALAVLIPSGLQIFNAFPSFGSKIPERDLLEVPAFLTLGGWLAGALQWHFTFAWLLIVSLIVYVFYQAISRNWRQVTFVRRDVRGVWPMARHYFLFGPKPEVRESYNPLQKLAYTTAIALMTLSVTTGLALYKPVQLSWLVTLMGGFQGVRIWHFLSMCGLLAFIPGHLMMVAIHGWSNFAAMWTGWKRS
jgi:Ni/Fe-hydrogenase b-type cytochrome subunit